MKLSVPSAISRRSAMTVLKLRKNSPSILFAGGIVLGVATVVTACKATLKVDDVLIKGQKELADINLLERTAETTEEKRAKTRVYVRTTARLIGLYSPSIALGVASVACLTQSHRILTSRNAGLAAAYSAVDKAFDEYRQRVRDEYGEDKEREIYTATTEEKVEVEGKNGQKSKVKKKVKGGGSPYAKFFGFGNKNWNSGPEYNAAFLRLQQSWANDRLHARGHLFLNEFYQELGLPHTKEGAVVGWLYNHPEAGDGYVDLGIWNEDAQERFHDFVTGREDGIWLDFNVDGPIWEYI